MKKIAVLTLSAAILLVSCDAYNNSNKTQRGAVIGAAGGALLGAILGNNVGNGQRTWGSTWYCSRGSCWCCNRQPNG